MVFETNLSTGQQALATAALERLVNFYATHGLPEKAVLWRQRLLERQHSPKNNKDKN